MGENNSIYLFVLSFGVGGGFLLVELFVTFFTYARQSWLRINDSSASLVLELKASATMPAYIAVFVHITNCSWNAGGVYGEYRLNTGTWCLFLAHSQSRNHSYFSLPSPVLLFKKASCCTFQISSVL